ncbi:tetratricopeptide repeat protein [Patescibacteria group bacterium]
MKKIILLSIAIIVVGCGSVFGYFYWQNLKEDEFLSSDPRTKVAYEVVQKRQKEVKENKDDYDAYMSLAFHWKGIGEVTRDEKYSWKAVKVYSEVIKRWGSIAYLPFVNQANVYILLEEYDLAEENFKIAIEIEPGEQNLYIYLAELYKNYMNKDEAEVEAVYIKGIETVLAGSNLVNSYAVYLRDVGDYEKSLQYFKMLQQAYPDNISYEGEIKEIEEKLQQS